MERHLRAEQAKQRALEEEEARRLQEQVEQRDRVIVSLEHAQKRITSI